MSSYDLHVGFWGKRQTIDVDKKIISLQEYADKNSLTYSGAYRRLSRQQIKGYKSFGRWWIYQEQNANGG